MSKNGDFVWYDLMAGDVDSAKKFYGELIGWDTQVFEQAADDKPYEMWVGADGPLGGVMKLPEEAKAAGAPPHWLAYTAVEDAEATVKKVEELGGKALMPITEITNDGGVFTILQDPDGAVFGIVAGDKNDKGAGSTIGKFTWHELAATDYEKAAAFYGEIFGWKKGEAADMGPAGIYLMYNNGGDSLGGMFNKPAEMPGPPSWMLYVSVEDCDAATEKAKSLGATVLNGPMDVPGGDRIAQLMDPQGAAFALHSSKKS